MKHRMLFIMVSLLALMFLWTGCKTVSDLTKSSEERNLIRLKRGSLNEAGLYTNIFYEFEVRMPEGWQGKVEDPPNLLTVNPSAKDISQSSARDFIDVLVRIIERRPDETLAMAIDRYTQSRAYQLILERPSMVQGGESKKVLFYGKSKNKEMKIISLFVMRENNLIVVECRALKPLFDNVEAQFGACIDSFRVTGDIQPGEAEGRDDMKQDEDYVVFIVSTRDTPEQLARDFLGSEDRAWMIMSINEIDALKPGERIRIPRFISYDMKPDDTLPLIAQRILGNAQYADLIRNYNDEARIEKGESLFIPLYMIHMPVVGESYRDIARRYYNNEDLADRLLQYNNLEPIESLAKVRLPIFFNERFYRYRVQSNDTLAWISRWLTGDPQNYQTIADANGITYPYRLSVGQELLIPASLVRDPSVFDKPIPRANPPTAKPTEEPRETPKPDTPPPPTPTPRAAPITDPGLFDIE